MRLPSGETRGNSYEAAGSFSGVTVPFLSINPTSSAPKELEVGPGVYQRTVVRYIKKRRRGRVRRSSNAFDDGRRTTCGLQTSHVEGNGEKHAARCIQQVAGGHETCVGAAFENRFVF